MPMLTVALSLLSLLGLCLCVLRPSTAEELSLERLCLGMACALGLIAGTAALVYITELPRITYWLIPCCALVGIITHHRQLFGALAEPLTRTAATGFLLLLAWELTLLSLVRVHAGGGWAGDWVEHYCRIQFFLHHWPLDTLFLEQYTLPARPPLVNLVECALLSPLEASFASHQALSALLSCLAYFPLSALLLKVVRAPRPRHLAMLVLLLMCNACFNQNVAFTWTKLPTGGLILTCLLFLWDDSQLNPRQQILAWSMMGLAILSHYSAVVWACGLYLLIPLRLRWSLLSARGLRALTLPPAIVALVVSPWIMFCMLKYGLASMVSSTSTASSMASNIGGQMVIALLNTRDTLIPFFAREIPETILSLFVYHPSPLATVHDVAFNTYQCCLTLSLGLSGLLAAALAIRHHELVMQKPQLGWVRLVLVLSTTIVLGCAAPTARDYMGLTHICLAPLMLLGLIPVCAWFGNANATWRAVFLCLAAIDLALGTILHFLVQSGQGLYLDAPGAAMENAFKSHGLIPRHNYALKEHFDLIFLGDLAQAWQPVLWILAATLLLLAARLAWPRPGCRGGDCKN